MREHVDVTRTARLFEQLWHRVRHKMTAGQLMDSLVASTPYTLETMPDEQFHAAMVTRLRAEHASQRLVKSGVHIPDDDEASLAVA